MIDPGDSEHPEQESKEFEHSLKRFQQAHADEIEVDLVAEYEEAKRDYCCVTELRKLDKKTT